MKKIPDKMIKDAYLNGKHLYDTWGAQLEDGAPEALLTPPPMKEYITNECAAEHGTRYTVPAGDVYTAKREVQLSFFLEGSDFEEYITRYQSFTATLAGGELSLEVPSIDLTFRLLYISCGKYGHYGKCRAKITAKFVEPNCDYR